MEARNGMTTGSCAAAAAAAAAQVLAGLPPPTEVTIDLPEGGTATLPIEACGGSPRQAHAAVRKDAGDDPDITDGVTVEVALRVADEGDVAFRAGNGVGRVTKPGLAISQNEPAINPVPRQMIIRAIRKNTAVPVEVTVSIPGGEALAARTFNPRLGIVGGLSILGTTGVVRPFSTQSVRETIRCSLNVAAAAGIGAIVLVPGNIGRKAAFRRFCLAEEQVVEVGNEWEFATEALKSYRFVALMVLGHPGKLAKLAAGDWDTHSARSRSAVPAVRSFLPDDLASVAPESPTVEALFDALPENERRKAGDRVADAIRQALRVRLNCPAVAAALIDLKGEITGTAGDFSPWKEMPRS